MAQGIVFTAYCYDTKRQLSLLAFADARTEDGRNWQWFLELLTNAFQHNRYLYRMAQKDLNLEAFKELLEDHTIPHTRVCVHILELNLPKSGIKYKDGEKSHCIELNDHNPYHRQIIYWVMQMMGVQLRAWWEQRAKFCASYCLLSWDIYHLGTITSYASEQLNRVILPFRELPIIDLISSLVGRILNDTCNQNRESIRLWIQVSVLHRMQLELIRNTANHLYASSTS